jgi:hypothetical protein
VLTELVKDEVMPKLNSLVFSYHSEDKKDESEIVLEKVMVQVAAKRRPLQIELNRETPWMLRNSDAGHKKG